MNIGILGAGNVGSALARRLASKGHDLSLSFSLERAKLEATAREVGAKVVQPEEIGPRSDVIVLATPWAATRAALGAVGNLSGNLIWDCTNPLNHDMSGLALGPKPLAANRSRRGQALALASSRQYPHSPSSWRAGAHSHWRIGVHRQSSCAGTMRRLVK